MEAQMKLSIDVVMDAAAADEGIGFCLACGEEQAGCEPDAREYECESCGAYKVYGAEEILLQGLVL
jgi:hypothetical protein